MSEFLIFIFGGAVTYGLIALRMRVSGESVTATLRRPWSGGGPRPGTPR